MTSPYPASYLQGIAHFNAGRYFEAHEAWEDVWMPCRDDARHFYQGLIQIAVCLHHFGRGNTRGARKLYFSSTRYLAPYGNWYLGVDLERLLEDFRHCLREVTGSESVAPQVVLDRQRLPQIHFCETA